MQCTDPITRINVSNEYDELKSIIVGRLPQPHEDITFDYISMLADEDDTSAFSLEKNNQIQDEDLDLTAVPAKAIICAFEFTSAQRLVS